MSKSFISLGDLTLYEFHSLLDMAQDIQKKPERYRKRLSNRSLALLFSCKAPHIQAAFELGIRQMSGTSVRVAVSESLSSLKNMLQDLLKTLENWVQGVALFDLPHSYVHDLATNIRIPLLNAGSDLVSPVQALTDIFTIKQFRRNLAETRLAFIGRGGPVCHSLLLAGAKAGISMIVATPPGFEPDPGIVQQAKTNGSETGFQLILTQDPREAVLKADVVYTSSWHTKTTDIQDDKLEKAFSAYQVTGALLELTSPRALFMHPQPVFRGNEVTADVMESSASAVFKQAENKLHIQKAIMVLYLVENYNYND